MVHLNAQEGSTIATASKFTKVTLVQSLKLDEAKALIKFMELAQMTELSVAEQQLVMGIHQTMKKAMDNGRT